MGARFWQDWQEAVDRFVVVEDVDGVTRHYVEAEADTASRYVVLGTRIATRGYGENAVFVTVVQPYQTAWVMQHGLHHSWNYVEEHLRSPRRKVGESHGGDLAAVTICAHLVTGWSLAESLGLARGMAEQAVAS
jgi:hypothetical protein